MNIKQYNLNFHVQENTATMGREQNDGASQLQEVEQRKVVYLYCQPYNKFIITDLVLILIFPQSKYGEVVETPYPYFTLKGQILFRDRLLKSHILQI